jgi:hypothetical protein
MFVCEALKPVIHTVALSNALFKGSTFLITTGLAMINRYRKTNSRRVHSPFVEQLLTAENKHRC